MRAIRKDPETDLFVDVFFTNLIKGANGETPEIGANGNWWINGVDTGILARGIDGKTIIPEIGINGNWWVDGVDTGVAANIQSDWDQSNETEPDYIKNKPKIPSKISELEDTKWCQYVFTNTVTNRSKSYYVMFTLRINKALGLYTFILNMPVEMPSDDWDVYGNNGGVNIYLGADGPNWDVLYRDINIEYTGCLMIAINYAEHVRGINLVINSSGVFLCGHSAVLTERISGTRRIIPISLCYEGLKNFPSEYYSKWER